MKWEELNDLAQLEQIDKESETTKVLIFKHSTRCSISDTALSRFSRDWQDQNNSKIKPYYLDLIKHRPISNAIAERYHVEHESPQVLLVSAGKCVYSETHLAIQVAEIMSHC